ncbi:MAG: hypothetical protein AAF202_13610, partial [Pseudomonadota bacterium]
VGQHKSKFKKFGLKPPQLLGGVMASVSDKLELLFQLNTSEVLGAQSILSTPSTPAEANEGSAAEEGSASE